MLISFDGKCYFETSDVRGVYEWKMSRTATTEDGIDKEIRYIKIQHNNGGATEIQSEVIPIGDVVKAINDAREKERIALLEPLTSIAYELNRLFVQMAQDGVCVRNI